MVVATGFGGGPDIRTTIAASGLYSSDLSDAPTRVQIEAQQMSVFLDTVNNTINAGLASNDPVFMAGTDLTVLRSLLGVYAQVLEVALDIVADKLVSPSSLTDEEVFLRWLRAANQVSV